MKRGMIRVRSAIAAAIGLVTSIGPLMADPMPVAWPDLIDPASLNFEDPFRELSYAQLDRLSTVVHLRLRLKAGEQESASSALQSELTEAEEWLAAEGLDVDWILSQRWTVAENREKASTSGNPSLDGAKVRLVGYAIPAPPDSDGTPVAYLVPQRGMCSHVPPPDPNQLVRVRLGAHWSPTMLHEPVRLTGRISISPSFQTINVVDGLVPMKATFLMTLDEVETLADVRDQPRQQTDGGWAGLLVEGLRSEQGEDYAAPTQ